MGSFTRGTDEELRKARVTGLQKKVENSPAWFFTNDRTDSYLIAGRTAATRYLDQIQA